MISRAPELDFRTRARGSIRWTRSSTAELIWPLTRRQPGFLETKSRMEAIEVVSRTTRPIRPSWLCVGSLLEAHAVMVEEIVARRHFTHTQQFLHSLCCR
nr:hypothetical protein CFP56_19453 [Quercus suber]